MKKKEVTLAIEAAIEGGSLALVSEGSVLLEWQSSEKVARSEELLLRISELLDQADLSKEEIGAIAVSRGPGSYTGIRIGLATAMGLARSLNIPCVGISALRAVAVANSAASPKSLVVLPIGRSGYAWQMFESDGSVGTPETGTLDEFETSRLANDKRPVILAYESAYTVLCPRDADPGSSDLWTIVGRNIASAVGTAALIYNEGLEPFYARETEIRVNGGSK